MKTAYLAALLGFSLAAIGGSTGRAAEIQIRNTDSQPIVFHLRRLHESTWSGPYAIGAENSHHFSASEKLAISFFCPPFFCQTLATLEDGRKMAGKKMAGEEG